MTGIEYFQVKFAHEAEDLKSVKAPRTLDDLIVKAPQLCENRREPTLWNTYCQPYY